MLQRRGLERRLFGWMLVLALVPALGLVALGTWVWTDSLDRISTLGPWDRVGESGRTVFDAAAAAAEADPALAEALDRHREELSGSLLLARRWAFLRERLMALLPGAALLFGLVLVGAALAAARRVSRELARPIRELVGWAELLAREESLPAARPAEQREVTEVRALRRAFRAAEGVLSDGRRRALEVERVRVWGEMARRVAHEMKNPLTPLRLALHRLARYQAGDVVIDETTGVIAEEVARLEELARQFAMLGRPPEGPMSQVDLRELLVTLLDTDVAAPVETELDAPADLPLVDGHYEALVRAFRNLVRNAVEAMEGCEGPRLVRVGIREVGEIGGWVEVRIADGGPGLPAGAEDRIFEPDFTTKSRGTGLGLTLVRQAVVAHGGTIILARHPAGGAEFVVRLPVSAPPAAPVARTEMIEDGAALMVAGESRGWTGAAKNLRSDMAADGVPPNPGTGQ
jgi:nitrogen fixation/metabolism regulation signal transduction histidine kinase